MLPKCFSRSAETKSHQRLARLRARYVVNARAPTRMPGPIYAGAVCARVCTRQLSAACTRAQSMMNGHDDEAGTTTTTTGFVCATAAARLPCRFRVHARTDRAGSAGNCVCAQQRCRGRTRNACKRLRPPPSSPEPPHEQEVMSLWVLYVRCVLVRKHSSHDAGAYTHNEPARRALPWQSSPAMYQSSALDKKSHVQIS